MKREIEVLEKRMELLENAVDKYKDRIDELEIDNRKMKSNRIVEKHKNLIGKNVCIDIKGCYAFAFAFPSIGKLVDIYTDKGGYCKAALDGGRITTIEINHTIELVKD